MVIVELCGVPGCGKSTLLSYYEKHYNNKHFLMRNDLYPSSRILRNIQVRFDLIFYRFFKQKREEDIFKDLFEKYADAPIHSKFRIIDLYKRISRLHDQKGILVLEEGPIQYLTSLSPKKIIELRSEIKDYFTLYDSFEYHVVYCVCDNETSINRIANRNKAPGFFNVNRIDIDELIEVKRANIETIIQASAYQYIKIDMTLSLERNAEILNRLINSIEL